MTRHQKRKFKPEFWASKTYESLEIRSHGNGLVFKKYPLFYNVLNILEDLKEVNCKNTEEVKAEILFLIGRNKC